MKDEKKKPRTHLNLEQRCSIEHYLNEGENFTGIAKDLGVSQSTIYREVKRNRRAEGLSHTRGSDRSDCEYVKSCKIKGLCGQPELYGCFSSKLCKHCKRVTCHELCCDYERRVCPTVEKSPFVCNACKRFSRCTIERFRYSAKSAQANADYRNTEARSGFDLTSEEVEHLVEVVLSGLGFGQSIHHIFTANEMPCSERTFYRLVENESIPIMNIQLAKKVKYKKRRQKKSKGTHAKGFYKGYEYKDYLTLSLRERAITIEVDTVWGKRGDNKVILSLHRTDLHFQIYLLLSAKTTEQVVEALDWLEACCAGRFSEFFGLLLFDRGSEFDDISGMRRSFVDGSNRAQIFFTDPCRPDQKGACEKNHVELRKIVPKKTSLEEMDVYTLATICSHVNSTIRKGCGDTTPMQLAMMCLPQEIFDNLGLSLISPHEVIAAPGILYGSHT